MPLCLLFSLCLLSNLLLKPCYAFKIHNLILLWICSQTCLKIMVKIITHFFYNCWSLNCNKLCSNKFVNNFLSCSICCNPKICCFSIISPLFLFVFIFNFFYTIVLSMPFSLRHLGIQQMSQHVIGNIQLINGCNVHP